MKAFLTSVFILIITVFYSINTESADAQSREEAIKQFEFWHDCAAVAYVAALGAEKNGSPERKAEYMKTVGFFRDVILLFSDKANQVGINKDTLSGLIAMRAHKIATENIRLLGPDESFTPKQLLEKCIQMQNSAS